MYTFHDFSRRFIKGCNFTFRQWLWFLKLYELNVPSKEMARQLKVSYVTVLKARDITRRAILAQALDANSYYRLGIRPGSGRRKGRPTMRNSPVFGVLDLGGYVICDLMSDLTVENILHFKLNFCLKTSHLGQLVYTSPYQKYTALTACGPDLWTTNFIRHGDTRIPVDATDFWRDVKARLRSVRGVNPTTFPLYLKEWELRFNNRGESLVPVLAAALCGFVPKS